MQRASRFVLRLPPSCPLHRSPRAPLSPRGWGHSSGVGQAGGIEVHISLWMEEDQDTNYSSSAFPSTPHPALKPFCSFPFPRQSAPGQLFVALIAALLRVRLLAALKDHEELIFFFAFEALKRLIFKFCFPLKHPIFLPAEFRSSDKQDPCADNKYS